MDHESELSILNQAHRTLGDLERHPSAGTFMEDSLHDPIEPKFEGKIEVGANMKLFIRSQNNVGVIEQMTI